MSAADLLNEAATDTKPSPLESVLQGRVDEAKSRLGQLEAEHKQATLLPEHTFLRAYIAGINHSIRRVRESEATRG